jgi:hypothetical protein
MCQQWEIKLTNRDPDLMGPGNSSSLPGIFRSILHGKSVWFQVNISLVGVVFLDQYYMAKVYGFISLFHWYEGVVFLDQC